MLLNFTVVVWWKKQFPWLVANLDNTHFSENTFTLSQTRRHWTAVGESTAQVERIHLGAREHCRAKKALPTLLFFHFFSIELRYPGGGGGGGGDLT